MTKSYTCHGCKFLYIDGQGYSDYTWEENFLTCALDLNKNLPIEEPWDYDDDMAKTLRWMATLSFECERFAPGKCVTVSPDGNVKNFTDDDEQMCAIIEREAYDDNNDLDLCRKHENVHGSSY